MCWLLLGQARFTESAELAVKTADKIEPRRLSKASPDHLAMWGWMNIRAISGAVRNNQYDLAEQAYRLANSAASAIGKEIAGQFQSGVTFGPVTAAMANLEIAMVKGDARTVLEKADTEELSFKARKLSGNPRPNSWYRHRLDIAKAHVKQGGYQEAALELKRMKGKAPTWLSHQRMAKDVMRDVQRKRKRTLTVEMREMAAFLGVDR